jgi:hypothetical protein
MAALQGPSVQSSRTESTFRLDVPCALPSDRSLRRWGVQGDSAARQSRFRESWKKTACYSASEDNSTITGVWSLGFSHLRGTRSITQPFTSGCSAALTRMWSMRRPRFFW